MLKIVIVLGLFLAGVIAQNYGGGGSGGRAAHSAPAYQAAVPLGIQSYKPASASAPQRQEEYGPDTSNFQYQVPIYDAKTYAKADLNVNRFPGGANYQVDENGQGSNFKLTYEHTGTGKKIKAPSAAY